MLITALALAKVMLVAQDLHLADRFHDVPLIYPILLKSFVYTVVLACFKMAEDFAIGRIHDRSFQESTSDLGGGTRKGILTLAALVFAMLIPFVGVTELRRVLGADRWFGVFLCRGISSISICLPLEPAERQAERLFTRFWPGGFLL